jgi:hypothetical protein
MDEFDRGMEPELRRYFRKIMNSFSYGLMWMMAVMIAGIYFRLGVINDGVAWYNVLFFVLAFASFCGLIYYFYKTWK